MNKMATFSEDTGGFLNNFSDAPDDLVCLICTNVCRETHQVSCCGRVFCKSCIKQVKSTSGSCPNCRVTPLSTFSDQRSDRQIKQLKVSCDNEEEGCEWSGTLADHSSHMDVCEYVQVNCPNDCDGKIQRRSMDEHVTNTCPKRKVSCSFCTALIPFNDEEAHFKECPKGEAVCPNTGCTAQVIRDQLDVHLSVCSKQIVSCEFKEGGCDVHIFREDVGKHMQDDSQRHLTLALSTIAGLKAEVSALKAKLIDVQHQLCSSSIIPVTFRMTSYSAKKASRQTWVSGPFFTHEGGYKLQLHSKPCGDKPNNLSLFVHHVRSENEDSGQLVWPLCGTMDLQILNQRQDDHHHVRRLVIPLDLKFGSTEEGWGYPSFMEHTELEKQTSVCQYVENDCIFFRVAKVKITYDHAVPKPWLSSGLVVSRQ